MKKLLSLILLLLSFSIHSQTLQTKERDSLVKRTRIDTLRHTAEFSKDSYTLSDSEVDRFITFLKKLNALSVTFVSVVGHTDSDGSDVYNAMLSEKRANSVKQIFDDNTNTSHSIELAFMGEKQLLNQDHTLEEQQRNRRVELMVFHAVEYETWIPCGGTYNCRDTLIKLPSGVMYAINRCVYRRNPNCVSIQEFLSPDQLQEANLLTMDTDGNTLFSAGMLKYSICDTVKIRAYIPIDENCFSEGMKKYEQTENGWQLATEPEVEIETINSIRYYVLPLQGSGMINMDQVGFPTVPPKIKFKSKRGVKLEQVAISCDCPMASVAGGPKNRRKRKVVLPRVCCPDPVVRIVLTNKNGELITLPYQPLNNLKRIRSIGGCKGEEKWRVLFIKKREKVIYKKYRVKY